MVGEIFLCTNDACDTIESVIDVFQISNKSSDSSGSSESSVSSDSSKSSDSSDSSGSAMNINSRLFQFILRGKNRIEYAAPLYKQKVAYIL